jgi:hypothetical protein
MLGVHVNSMHTVIHVTIDENEALSTIYNKISACAPEGGTMVRCYPSK